MRISFFGGVGVIKGYLSLIKVKHGYLYNRRKSFQIGRVRYLLNIMFLHLSVRFTPFPRTRLALLPKWCMGLNGVSLLCKDKINLALPQYIKIIQNKTMKKILKPGVQRSIALQRGFGKIIKVKSCFCKWSQHNQPKNKSSSGLLRSLYFKSEGQPFLSKVYIILGQFNG